MLSALFNTNRPRAALSANDIWGEWPGGEGGTNTKAGVQVTETNAMQLLTVYGCVRLITDSISTMPLDVFRRVGDTSQEITKPPWLSNPTPDLEFESWVGQILASLLLHGNAYFVVSRNPTGAIVELVVLDPVRVAVTRQNGRKVFTVDGMPVRPGTEMKHLRGLMLPGSDVGLSPVEYARQSIGLGMAALNFGADVFTNEGNMPGVIELPHDAQPDTMRELANQWRKKRRTGGKGLPGVLKSGATWKPTGVTNEQAQFLATRQFTAAEIAGQMFLVDPADLGIPVQGVSITYANLEQRNARRVQVTLLPWIIRVERVLSDLLASPRYVKFNVDGLLRGDQKSRYESYEIGIRSQFLLPNEAREFENWTPLDGGDTPPEVPNAPNPVP